MQQASFVEHITHQNPSLSELTDELNAIIEEYPFFASAHLLLSKSLFKQNSIHYSKQLRKTALVSNSRRVLYDYIHKQEAESQIKSIQPEQIIVETKQSEQPIQSAKETNETHDNLEENTIAQPKPNPVTVTSDDIKVIYISTPITEKQTSRQDEEITEKISNSEIELIQNIENSTQNDVQEKLIYDEGINEDKINKQIENEVNRSIVHAYVETEIIKTPELEKEDAKEPVSFTDWLSKIKKEAHTIQKVEKPKKFEEKETKELPKPELKVKKPSFLNQNMQIIDKIIESDPGRIKLTQSKFYTPASDSKQSLVENEHLVTETLAKIYALQGNISKAIRAYEILSLKFPQKSVYFASLIEKLKSNK
jgi:hypothetical protein